MEISDAIRVKHLEAYVTNGVVLMHFEVLSKCVRIAAKKVFSQDRKKRIKPSQHSRKKHLSKLCERCVSGKHCMSNKVHAKTGYESQHVLAHGQVQCHYSIESENESESDDSENDHESEDDEHMFGHWDDPGVTRRYPSSSGNRYGRGAVATNNSNWNARTNTKKDSMSGAELAGALAGGASVAKRAQFHKYGTTRHDTTSYARNEAFSARI